MFVNNTNTFYFWLVSGLINLELFRLSMNQIWIFIWYPSSFHFITAGNKSRPPQSASLFQSIPFCGIILDLQLGFLPSYAVFRFYLIFKISNFFNFLSIKIELARDYVHQMEVTVPTEEY